MRVEIVERLSKTNTTHIKIECANGDSIRLDVEEYQKDNLWHNRILVTSVETDPHVQPKTSNQILINFRD